MITASVTQYMPLKNNKLNIMQISIVLLKYFDFFFKRDSSSLSQVAYNLFAAICMKLEVKTSV